MPELRLGVIGCGRVVEVFHLPALRRSALWSIRAISDTSQDRLDAVRAQAPQASLWLDPEQMLVREPLEAVLVATPPDEHLRWVRAVLSANLHVLVEKPGGMSAEQSREMARAAEGRVAWAGFNRRFMRPYRELRAALAGVPNAELREANSHISFSISEWRPVSGYLGDEMRGGSVRHDVLAHQADLLPWIFDDPVVEASSDRWEDSAGQSGVIAFHLALRSGRVVGGTAAHGRTYQERLLVSTPDSVWLALPTGLTSSHRLSPRSVTHLGAAKAWLDRKWIRLRLKSDPMRNSFVGEWEAFGDQILGRTPDISGVSLDSLARLHETLEALRRSADSGRPVRISA